MTLPNKWFLSDGRLMLDDSANPFEGWKYSRLAKLTIQIYSFDKDARMFQRTLKSNASPPQIFNRIEVSNIVDKNYVGMSVLSDWGPLLNKSDHHCAIIGLFMNWQT
ncbi:hypothetical protein IW261DRAFT_1426699 [Armillaria novae-zelandiae]|uniref:Uncharacterized protein n=1 Tax=Armillaria novae-zelandiae TaxID=153914 RepID=A0AA39T5X6_9AGAR|nr:hypothetical protein IW261DRAFT_1426699 [Armillaria novae-zelandiae]